MLDNNALRGFIDHFFGYGELEAPIWFIGMEEGGGASQDEIEARLATWVARGRPQVDDLAEFHLAFGDGSRFVENAPIQSTWKELIRVMLLLNGKTPTRETMRAYQIAEFGRKGNGVALLELLPLPKPSLKAWPYAAWTCPNSFPELHTVDSYKDQVIPQRIAAIRELIAQHAPKAVVFYGKKYLAHWEAISGAEFVDALAPHYVDVGNTTFVLLPHPVAFGAAATSQFERAAMRLKPKVMSQPSLYYEGGIAYENWPTGSRAQRFEMRDPETILLDILTKVDDPAIPAYHLIGTAKRVSSGNFETGMVALKTAAGESHSYGHSGVEFTVMHLDEEIVKIEGAWIDGDGYHTRYPFTAVLRRAHDVR